MMEIITTKDRLYIESVVVGSVEMLITLVKSP